MKKMLALGLVLAFLTPALFADDAMVMPAGVGRFYVAPIFSFAPGAYDEKGKLQKFDDGSVQVFNLGFALEYGVNSWITAAIQWVPGWTMWSDIEAASEIKKSNTNGVADIFAGAKFQIVGANAPVVNEDMRFAVALGAIIPLPGPDFEKEIANVGLGKDATLANMDNHVFAAGARFAFDYIINDKFFINLYNETRLYPVKGDLKKHGPTLAGLPGGIAEEVYIGTMIATGGNETAAGLAALNAMTLAAAGLADATGEVNYRYRLNFEIEPAYSTFIADGIRLSAGLPINYTFTPAPKISVSGVDTTNAELNAILNAATGGTGPINLENTLLGALAEKDSQLLYVGPNIGIFVMTLPLPMEFKFTYNLPVWGKNANATHNAIFQIRAYFAF
ncbi:MAG: hypothetical protein LBC80_09485 [Treponema sp.]|nr:hypothetical protein [Treponema sp.]